MNQFHFPLFCFLLVSFFNSSLLGVATILPENSAIGTLRVSFDPPGMDRVFAQKISSADLGNDSFSWVGKISGKSSGFLSFVKIKKYYHGSLSMFDGSFVSFQGEDGEMRFNLGRKKYKPCGGCKIKNYIPADPRYAAQPVNTWHNGDANLIDLLVVYPTIVKTKAGGSSALEALIASAIADANLCYRNSLVPMQIRLVYSAELSYTPTGALDIELERLGGTGDGYMDEVHSLRDTYGADLVAMLTTESDSGGLANTMSHPSLSFAPSGFNVNVWDQIGAPSYTLAHEIGHNMGCLHNREDSEGDREGYNFAAFSFGKRWIENGQGYGTIMSYDTKPTSTYPVTIPYFSNPNVSYLSTITGNDNSEDNAQVLASTAPYVSNFRRSVVQSILPTAFSYVVQEGNSTSFSVRLTVQPTSSVTVNLAISGDNDLLLSGPSSLQFDSSNWNLPHPVQISAQPDTDSVNGTATLVLSASGITSTSIQITESDLGTSLESKHLLSGVIQNELGMGVPRVTLTFSHDGSTIQTDENGAFRNLLSANLTNSVSYLTPDVVSQASLTGSPSPLVTLSASELIGGKVAITAESTVDSLYSVVVEFSNLNNMQPSQTGPLLFNLQGRGSFELLTLDQIDPTLAWGYNWNYWWNSGFSGTSQDLNHSYLIPYAPEESYLLSQGYMGSYSHQDSYALDWLMPEGTTIRASRGGRVIGVKEDSNEGGTDISFADKANYVTIGHRDGSKADYLHLKENGALVEVGQEVQAGEAIGLSGNTGWSTDPHLHFQVFHQTDPRTSATVATNFVDHNGNAVILQQGTTYLGSAQIGTVTPSLSGYTFSPSNLSIQSLNSHSLGNLFQTTRSTILYVDQNASGRGDGTSWFNAYNELGSALVSMNEFTEVWVAEGTYYPGNTQADSFILPPGISVLGGFSGTESTRSERNSSTYVTTLSGDIGTIGDGSDNSYHVVIPSQNSSLDGFVIRDGNASQNFTDYRGLGGGLFADSAEFIISNCSFIDNQSYQRGGAVCVIDSNATFKNSLFTGQFSTVGGVIDANNSTLILEYCEFSNNSSGLEGGVLNSVNSEVNATNCVFNSNQNTENNGAGAVNVEGGTFLDVNGSYSNNQSLSKGGAVYAEGATLSFSNANFQSNQSVYQGGAIRTLDSNVTLLDTNFTSNTSTNNSGGAVYFENGTFSDTNGVYSQNISIYQGGALVLKNAQSQLSSSIFTGNQNSTTNGAGALYLTDSNLSVSNCAFNSNSAAFQGGAIIWEDSTGSISDSNFTENINTTSNGGGGISLKNSSPSISRCIFTGNISQPSYGGAIYLDSSSPTIEDSTFTRNKTNTFDGGAIHINSTSQPTITGNTFTYNVAGQSGGAINIESSANPTISNNTFSFNSSSGWGGAIYNASTSFALSQSTFLSNSSNLGGAVSSAGSVISFSGIQFLGNEANSSSSSKGGALHLATGTSSSTFINCIFSGNKSLGRYGVYSPKGATRFVNCTVVGNEAGTDGGVTLLFGGDSIELDNCIVWGNSAGTGNDIWVNAGTAIANYSLFNPSHSIGTISGDNNLDSDPLFTDADGADNLYGGTDDILTLQSTSPAINQGSSSASNYSTFDINGRTRDANPDLGAFEYSSNTAPVFATSTTVSVSENQTAVIDINSTDSDSDTLSYSITGGSDQSKFQIDSGTGVLTFINSPDFESPTDTNGDGIYKVIVSVSDGTDTITQEVTVSILDGIDAVETFTVSGGQFSSPYYSITNSQGSVVDFSTYTFQKGSTYYFVASNISGSHPFMIGESFGDTSSNLVSGGPLTSSGNGERITLSIPSGFNEQLLYFCTAHSSMKQNLIISNQSPIISSGNSPLALILAQGTSISYDLNATDADSGDALSWSITSNASNGSNSVDSSTGVLSYSPTTHFNGSDSLAVQVSDGSLTDTLTINFTITASNDTPVISESSSTLALSLIEDGTFTYDLNATDADGDTLTWSVISAPSNGSNSVDSRTGVLSYTPTTHFNGSDSLAVQVSDGSLTDTLTINFTITASNDVPVISESSSTLALLLVEDGTFSYDLNATDTDGDTLTWSVISAPSNGSSLIDSSTGVLSYTPTTHFNGSDSLVVQVSDESLTDTLTVNFTISESNDAPTGISLSNSSIEEEQSTGIEVGIFSTVDVDLNSVHSYSLVSGNGSTDNSSFSLDSNGTLKTGLVFDFETKSTYSIRLRTSDQGGLSFEKVFTITITDKTEKTTETVVLLLEGVSISAGWKEAGWFGFYYAQYYPWVYHVNLGWVHVTEDESNGAWLYRETLGWLWTNPNLFPYLFRNTNSNWLYLDTTFGPTRYYDYSVSNWVSIE